MNPPLNEHETEYLRAFSATRRWDRPAGPHVVLPHPLADDEPDDADIDSYNRPAPGEPGLWCPWTATTDGRAISFDGMEKAYRPVEWLRYLIDTFLAPDATVAAVADPVFDRFTVDHVCDGAVAFCRRDTGRVSVILVTDNTVDERVLLPGVPEGVVWAGLPYEAEADRHRQAAAIRRAAYDQRLVSRVP
ncbi:MAG: hypothetical protein ACRDUA_15505 [Micromonosporaceae bacterium]